MNRTNLIELKKNPEFHKLIRPLHRAEYLQLEASIMSEGCRDPIAIWNNYIVDGHSRYEICTKHKVPFQTTKMDFPCRDAVIIWICSHQLAKKNISEEMRKFLIGMQFESEKAVNREIASKPQLHFPVQSDTSIAQKQQRQFQYNIALRIAEENRIAPGTVQKYAEYARALREIDQMAPDFTAKILSGRYRISHNNIVELSKLDPEKIKRAITRIEFAQRPYIQYRKSQRGVLYSDDFQIAEVLSPPSSVKEMPAYDPDAEIVGLTLTIPSWAGSLNRTQKKANFSLVSDSAKERLIVALSELQNKIQEMLSEIKET